MIKYSFKNLRKHRKILYLNAGLKDLKIVLSHTVLQSDVLWVVSKLIGVQYSI